MTPVAQIQGDWIAHRGSQQICALLAQVGIDAYFVGGCVRDDLMGRPVGDVDMACNAPPQRVMDAAQDAGLKVIPTGLDHGTVTVLAQGRAHEITSFRCDLATDGRHADVAFGADMHTDAARRDFTMNALYANAQGQVFDPLGGLPDLRAARVRFIGNPAQRIAEDYLRILRFFRFSAWYAGADAGFDADDLAVIADHLDGLDGLSAERIWAELTKLLSAPNPAPAVAAMGGCGALMRILPGAGWTALAPLVHLEGQCGWPTDPLTRFVAMGAWPLDRDLRLTRAQARHCELLARSIGDGTPLPALAQDHGVNIARAVALLRAALLDMPLMPDLDVRLNRAAAAVFPLRAADLPADLQGPAIGTALRRAKAAWVASDFTLGKDDLRRAALSGE